jgi:hypothetical protein
MGDFNVNMSGNELPKGIKFSAGVKGGEIRNSMSVYGVETKASLSNSKETYTEVSFFGGSAFSAGIEAGKVFPLNPEKGIDLKGHVGASTIIDLKSSTTGTSVNFGGQEGKTKYHKGYSSVGVGGTLMYHNPNKKFNFEVDAGVDYVINHSGNIKTTSSTTVYNDDKGNKSINSSMKTEVKSSKYFAPSLQVRGEWMLNKNVSFFGNVGTKDLGVGTTIYF